MLCSCGLSPATTFMAASTAPMPDMTSIAQTKTIPLSRCSFPPLRTASATPPAAIASKPAKMWIRTMSQPSFGSGDHAQDGVQPERLEGDEDADDHGDREQRECCRRRETRARSRVSLDAQVDFKHRQGQRVLREGNDVDGRP